MFSKYLVIENWEKSYPDPIILQKGEEVTVDASLTEPEWPDWRWCVAPGGKAGWVPVQILESSGNTLSGQHKTTVLEDYSANELTVKSGDIVVGNRILNGWLWCWAENDSTKGWVPLKNVKLAGLGG